MKLYFQQKSILQYLTWLSDAYFHIENATLFITLIVERLSMVTLHCQIGRSLFIKVCISCNFCCIEHVRRIYLLQWWVQISLLVLYPIFIHNNWILYVGSLSMRTRTLTILLSRNISGFVTICLSNVTKSTGFQISSLISSGVSSGIVKRPMYFYQGRVQLSVA